MEESGLIRANNNGTLYSKTLPKNLIQHRCAGIFLIFPAAWAPLREQASKDQHSRADATQSWTVGGVDNHVIIQIHHA